MDITSSSEPSLGARRSQGHASEQGQEQGRLDQILAVDVLAKRGHQERESLWLLVNLPDELQL